MHLKFINGHSIINLNLLHILAKELNSLLTFWWRLFLFLPNFYIALFAFVMTWQFDTDTWDVSMKFALTSTHLRICEIYELALVTPVIQWRLQLYTIWPKVCGELTKTPICAYWTSYFKGTALIWSTLMLHKNSHSQLDSDWHSTPLCICSWKVGDQVYWQITRL